MEPVQQAILSRLETRFSIYLEDPDFILATLLDPAWNIKFFKVYDIGKLLYLEITFLLFLYF